MLDTDTIRYPTYSEMIFINARITDDPDLITGKKKIRDIELLLAAEQRPQASAFGQDAYQSLVDKATVLLHAIARNHPFRDGNKRSGTIAALFLLAINGYAIDWSQEEALHKIVALAEGLTEWQDFAEWLPIAASDTAAPEPDINHDAALIDTLIHQQKWLLNELDKR